MPRPRLIAGAVPVVALALAAAGCPSRARGLVYDLAERLPVAERWSSREVILFGTPAAEPHQVEGFYREAAAPAGDRFLWCKGEAEVSLQWPTVSPRTAVVDLAPYRGVKAQSVEVRLNGAAVARFVLNDVRHRYRLELPGGAQRQGDNRLRFVFTTTASPSEQAGNPDRRQLAAAFYSLAVGGQGDPGLNDLLGRDAPRPFTVTQEGGVPVMVLLGPSVVRFAIRLPPDAELRFTPALHPSALAAAGSASFRVTVADETDAEKELWSTVLGQVGERRDSREVALALPGRPGDLLRLSLYVGAASSDRFAWGLWRAPRVLGRSGADPLTTPLRRLDDDQRADPLRQALLGTNVVLVILDAARAREFGCYGYGRATTPEIDRIAAEGVVFERAYTPAVYTLGAISSLWTSQYPDRHHAEVSYADRLPADRLTLAQALGGHGVKTAGFVANAMAGTAFGFDRGFDEFHELFRSYPELGSRGESFRRALPSWLAAQSGRRFFAYLHFREPHFPYDPGPPFATRFGPDTPLTREQRRDKAWYTAVNQGRYRPSSAEIEHLVRLYDGNLAYADQEVGALRSALTAAGLWDRTVLIITADHGEALYEHGYISHSAQVYEESVHVPLIVRFPRGPQGLRVPALVHLLDVARTVMDVLGLRGQSAAAREFQGRSLLPLLAGAPGKPAVLSRTVWDRPVYALRDDRFKLIYDTRTGQELLFDLAADPGESRSLQEREGLRAAYYRQSLQQWIERLGEARSEGSIPVAGGSLSPEQCQNLKALGYVAAECR